jgi:WD40 repeat protein
MVFRNDSGAVLTRQNQDVVQWNVETGKIEAVFPGVGNGIMSLAVSPVDDRVALGGYESNSRKSILKLGRLSQPKELRQLPFDDHYIESVLFSPDGTKLAAGSRTMTTIWDVETGRQLQRLSTPNYWTKGLAFLPEGNELVTGNNSLAVWSIASGAKVQSFVTERGGADSDRIYLTPDGHQILSSSAGKAVLLFDRTVFEPPPTKPNKS